VSSVVSAAGSDSGIAAGAGAGVLGVGGGGTALFTFGGNDFGFGFLSSSSFSLLPCLNMILSFFMSVSFQPSRSSPTVIFQ
jgi:hypothetical protein